MKHVFSPEHILVDSESTTQQQAFAFIARKVFELGFVDNAKDYEAGLNRREQESSTGLTGGVAIPHCKHATVKHAGIFVFRFAHPIVWETMDELPVNTTLALSIPASGNEDSVRMLTKLSRCMVRKAFRDVITKGDSSAAELAIANAIA
ncbi:PTS sugar transporter subunit IIA [Aeromonas sp. 164P]